MLFQDVPVATDSMVLCWLSQFAMNPGHYVHVLQTATVRLLKTPLPEGHSKNTTAMLDPMPNKYHRLRGWTREGIPTISTLSEAKLGYASKQVVENYVI